MPIPRNDPRARVDTVRNCQKSRPSRRQRSAHEHLGEAYLVQGDLIKAEEHLAVLERICLIPCDEYDDLKRAIAEYNKIARH